MKTKKCFKCNTVKNIDEFYRHKGMHDNHLNKCKECNKNDTKKRYNRNITDKDFLIQEQIRGRDKYHRLYKGKLKNYHPETKNLHRDHPLPKGKEYHHWNYNFVNSVFIVNRLQGHKLIHRFIKYDPDSKCYYDLKGNLLDTKEKHEQVIKDLNINYTFK